MKETFKKDLFNEVFMPFMSVLSGETKVNYELILADLWIALKDNEDFFASIATRKKEQLIESKASHEDSVSKIDKDLTSVDKELAKVTK